MVLGSETGWLYEGNMGGADGAGKALDSIIGFVLETFLCEAQGGSQSNCKVSPTIHIIGSQGLEEFESLRVHVVISVVDNLSILRGC